MRTGQLIGRLGAMDPPETRYVAVGDADVAYQVVGEGTLDLLYCFGIGNQVELAWDIPWIAEFMSSLATFSRLIFFDRRGTGASDGVPLNATPTWEEWTEDIVAVLSASGSRRTVIFAAVDAGPMAILFTAMHPDMVSALILLNTSARYVEASDYPIGASPDTPDALVELIATQYGTSDFTRLLNPSNEDDAEHIRLISKLFRSSATPRSAAAQFDYILRADVRDALPLIQAPTLVFHVSDSAFLPIAHGRYIADHIDNARFIELPGGDLGLPTDRQLLDEIAQFLTGERPVVEADRILTTVLFTDIVGSTEQVAALGDQRWRSLLDRHDNTVRDQLRRFRGKEIQNTGDGFVASFDGPARAVRCAQAVIETTANLGIEVRTGLHTGECEIRGDGLGGLAVHIAARIGALATAGEVLVSGTVKDLVVGSGIEFTERGTHELKGVPEARSLFAVLG
jgi:class 3 adenylate cyclase